VTDAELLERLLKASRNVLENAYEDEYENTHHVISDAMSNLNDVVYDIETIRKAA
jgi:hypothetical protein